MCAFMAASHVCQAPFIYGFSMVSVRSQSCDLYHLSGSNGEGPVADSLVTSSILKRQATVRAGAIKEQIMIKAGSFCNWKA
jgi:hypothetical protein